MRTLYFTALTTGILSAIWAFIANQFDLLSWAGFLGCTAYFAYPKEGIKGLAVTMATIMSGVIWALAIIYGSQVFSDISIFGYAVTGVIAFVMCIQAKSVLLAYIPGTFIGACTIFAAQGDLSQTIPSLIVGVLFGYAMKMSGLWVANKWPKTA
ncbi:DUF1097 domain-containing protein [Proteus cibarius]|uniref:Uncharacterized protein n=2 Tax=Proteus TaxID=583 RepID=A0A6C0VSF7_PROVU|nr:DUF1097 domain-containing protein [Proteus terrae]QHP78304.1 DUF1097 domain-containing protein [Proteus vulgaris]MBG3090505.1 DUF1097 domain-containing protein [Proteus terrae subsp. cibarius]MBG6039458.1 DUF1097 domain-containing protein [Proteus terrae subsp. cibarius]QGW05089.1 DUF1097 domain-containing protein [Proteus terrae subsp. cibarius]QHD94119.1 DUF1097 domain-containing protein [Proteus terrae subsp. cibarius]